jgi:DNA polymerase III epsilon subunit-like protein
MRVLVFDTETTGLPKTRQIDSEHLHLWPYIVQFSYVVYDICSNKVIKIVDEYVKIPENIIIPDECIKIHGVTNDMCKQKGKNISNLLDDFYNDFKNCERIVGHNLNFDLNMIKVELLRITKTDIYKNILDAETYKNIYVELISTKKNYCTMQETITYCNLKSIDKKGKEFIKFPKLSELYQKMFGTVPLNLHNSLNDVIICLRCYAMWHHNIDVVKECTDIGVFMMNLN